MKKATVFLGAILLALTTGLAHADRQLSETMIRNAKEAGFTGCEDTMRRVYDSFPGDNIKTTTVANQSTDFIRFISTAGHQGEAMLKDTTFIRHEDRCAATTSLQLTSSKSCAALLAYDERLEYEGETPDYLWFSAKNSSATTVLKQINGVCHITVSNYSSS
ncbi:hypothetical protein ACUN9V_05055 [Salinicola sp. V024]|uniref:hypothetical protein n=1 Tax=Salinicola sp. V024 TaxID=3459609 RepID=UPI0040445BD1